MASRTFREPPQSLERKVYEIHATFFPQGTSNPLFTPANCKGFASIVRNGTAGEWLITVQDTFRRILARGGSIQMASATDLNLQFATIAGVASTSPPTLIVRTLAGATPTDIAANANNSITVSLVVSDAEY
jgi:hypothetical protein